MRQRANILNFVRMASNTPSPRAAKLTGFFHAVTNGKRVINTASDHRLFHEAIRAQPSARACLETLCGRAHGLPALHASLRADLSPAFLRDSALPVVAYFLDDAAARSLANGLFLRKLLEVVCEPPTLWDQLVRLFLAGRLAKGDKDDDDRIRAFAHLAVEAVETLRADGDDENGGGILSDARAIVASGTLLKSPEHAVRELGYKLQRVVQLRTTPPASTTGSHTDRSATAPTPGGRHDNDFPDFRRIRLFPTTDELLCRDGPFLQKPAEIFSSPGAGDGSRLGAHLANQYRLLREDMLHELKEDFAVARGAKKGARRAVLCLSGLTPVAVQHHVSTDGANSRPQQRDVKCALALSCARGLTFPKALDTVEKRKAHLAAADKQAGLPKHRDFGCLCDGAGVLGFAFVHRDVDLLAQDPPVVCLEFTDEQALTAALLALKTGGADVQFVVINTAVFAYEPVLRGLQRITDLPLSEGIMDPAGQAGRADDFKVAKGLEPVVKMMDEQLATGAAQLSMDFGEGLKPTFDRSQALALRAMLGSAVSVVQGPPGKFETEGERSTKPQSRALTQQRRNGQVVYRVLGRPASGQVHGAACLGARIHQPRHRPVHREPHQPWHSPRPHRAAGV